MFIANDMNRHRVSIDQAKYEDQNRYFCPMCNGELIIRNGEINVAHFAHKHVCSCRVDSDMSEWHLLWQSFFPLEVRERIITFTFNQKRDINSYNNIYFDFHEGKKYKHIADICINGYVIEIQHSPISSNEFEKRNYFYERAGFKVIWIFDFQDEYDTGLIDFIREESRYERTQALYRWKHSKRIFENFAPHHEDNTIVFFQLYSPKDYLDKEECYIERVTWAIEADDGSVSFKRFKTNYDITNILELKEAIDSKKL